MAATSEGGRKAMATNKRLYGEDYAKRIGRMGGLVSRGGGFNPSVVGPDGLNGSERARMAGKKGGNASAKVRWGTKKSGWLTWLTK